MNFELYISYEDDKGHHYSKLGTFRNIDSAKSYFESVLSNNKIIGQYKKITGSDILCNNYVITFYSSSKETWLQVNNKHLQFKDLGEGSILELTHEFYSQDSKITYPANTRFTIVKILSPDSFSASFDLGDLHKHIVIVTIEEGITRVSKKVDSSVRYDLYIHTAIQDQQEVRLADSDGINDAQGFFDKMKDSCDVVIGYNKAKDGANSVTYAMASMVADAESDPSGIDQHSPGAKLDDGKIMAGLLGDFNDALLAVAEVGTFGANKYTRGGWLHVENGIERYSDAMWRHLLAEHSNPVDDDSGLKHAAQVAWNALARLQLIINEEKS